MSVDDDSQPSNSDEARAQLREGLKSCRSVVHNYRLMLTGDFTHLNAANDEDGGVEPTATDA